MRKHESLFVVVIAGPTGVGKTTLSKMLSKFYDCVYISEDEIAKEIFPDEYKNIEDYPDKVEITAYEELKPVIGEENYIDTGCQTPEGTFERLIAYIIGDCSLFE